MKDLTRGKILTHLITMAAPMAVGMFIQTLYFLVDLYFVGALGAYALAGVSNAGSVFFFVMALTQVLNIGCGTLVAHAVGRKDRVQANILFHQSMLIAAICSVLLVVLGYAFGHLFFEFMAPDPMTRQAAVEYFYWFLPALVLQFGLTVMAAALRGAGVVKPVMLISVLAVVLNIILSPVLISGWGSGIALGVSGAGLASSLSAICAMVMTVWYFVRKVDYLTMPTKALVPERKVMLKVINLGLPSGGEFLLTFMYMSIIYWALSQFAASAQAGFGLGIRIMQVLFLPVMAVAFVAPAIAAQNYAAGRYDRVHETYRYTNLLTCILMTLLTLVCLVNSSWFFAPFSDEPHVILVAATFLGYVCLNFVPAGFTFAASGMFQALGNTWPALYSTASRVVLFAVPVIWLAGQSDFEIEQIWGFSVATVYCQAMISYVLLRREMNKKLVHSSEAPIPSPVRS
ncbi:MATE family efflux transporter [Pseudoalteromonas rubra]|uniref:Multidrug-efflux transporter n=1 Tax=Pseudoalteromonas rubra TaxID=43658 RepID=A0A5S3WJ06_9GAMM|nr:MATE family efflux transporter [Pseudoalteromonas rubra]TMP27280.1 MATE family efflux transporter [Pseudoalteromonas rubra]TMP36818.1 MATE family efflux transporter [Pseudoalteromonas rubra]